jgi:thiol:disulfide interchange protein DsbA
MRKLLAFLLLALSTAACGETNATKYIEGTQYEAIAPQPVETGKAIEVREFFGYACPHCYMFEPHLSAWLKKGLPANAKFVRTPVVFRPDWEAHARAYYTFEALGAVEKLHGAFFEAIHKEKRTFADADAIAAFAAEHGVPKDKFMAAWNSFNVDAQTRKALTLSRSYNVTGVPSIVVDGKYLTDGSKAGGNEGMLRLTEHLVGKAAKERGKAAAKR